MFARSITEALSSKLLLVSIVDLLLVNGKDEDAGREGPAADIFVPGFSILLLIERIARKAPELAIVSDAGLRKGGRDAELDKNTESVRVDVVPVTPEGVG